MADGKKGAPRLTKPLLEAMASALAAALAGEWDGGDFDGLNRDHFERALEWVDAERDRREVARG